jgi:hypothetical protein
LKTIVFSIGDVLVSTDIIHTDKLPGNYLPFIVQEKSLYNIKYVKYFFSLTPRYYDPRFGLSFGMLETGEEGVERINTRPPQQLIIKSKTEIIHNHEIINDNHNEVFPDPNFFLYSLIYFLSEKGIFLHASGGIYNNFGFAFCGPSESGKTTIAKKWHPLKATILCDERIIIRNFKDHFLIYGSPWSGHFNYVCNQSAPLKYLFLLRNYGSFIEPVISPRLFIQNFLPLTYHRPWDIVFTTFILSFLNELFKKVPVFWVNRTKITSPELFFNDIEKQLLDK